MLAGTKLLFPSLIIVIVSLLLTSCPSPAGSTTEGQVSTPTFSPVANTYSGDQTVTISCGTPRAAIHYTADGTAPTGSSFIYSVPIPIAGNGTNETIKAIATKSGLTDSTVAAAARAHDSLWT